MNNAQPITRNIAKSGEVLKWGGFSPFQLHLGLTVNHSQSASCHIAGPLCGILFLIQREIINYK